MSSSYNKHFPYIMKVKASKSVYPIIFNNNVLVTDLFFSSSKDVLSKVKGVPVILENHVMKRELKSKHGLPYVFFEKKYCKL